jgi:hypothetical protein
MHNFDCIRSKSFTNTAATITPIKSAPNVLSMSNCGMRSSVEEDIVDCDLCIPQGIQVLIGLHIAVLIARGAHLSHN